MRNLKSFSCEHCNADIPILEKTLLTCPACGSPSWPGEVKALVRFENKIAAIKVYRSATGAGLKEAKDAVDGIALKGFLAIPDYYIMPAAPTSTAPTPPKEDSSSLQQELVDFINKNQLIAAIKHYREKSGVGLKEAKETIEALREGKPVKLLEASAGQLSAMNRLSGQLEMSAAATKKAEEELLQAIEQGNKIRAVKIYQEQTGLGLIESLDAVTAIIRGDKKSPLFR